jgi:hypothetical protein
MVDRSERLPHLDHHDTVIWLNHVMRQGRRHRCVQDYEVRTALSPGDWRTVQSFAVLVSLVREKINCPSSACIGFRALLTIAIGKR